MSKTLCFLFCLLAVFFANSVTAQSPIISITEPTNNASINAMCVDVLGNFDEKKVKRIIVSGMPPHILDDKKVIQIFEVTLPFIFGNRFEAHNVPLQSGTNIITVAAESVSGEVSSNVVTVIGPTGTNVAQTVSVQLQTSIIGGFAPLEVVFKVQAHVPGKIKNVYYHFDSDYCPSQLAVEAGSAFLGTIHTIFPDSEEYNSATQTNSDLRPVKHTYTNSGQFSPFVTIQTDVGRFSSRADGVSIFGGSPLFSINVQLPPVLLSTINIADPVDLKWTDASNLYVLSGSTATITEYNADEKPVRSLSGIVGNPSGLDVDLDGNVYVAAPGSNRVWKFKPNKSTFEVDTTFGNGGFIGNKDGNSGSKSNELNAPFDVAITSDFGGRKILVSDSGNHRIERFDKDGVFSIADGFRVGNKGEFLSSFGELGTNSGQLNYPKGIACDYWNDLAIVDSQNNRVSIASDFAQASQGHAGTGLGEFQGPWNLDVGKRGFYVADTGNNRVQVFEALSSHESSSKDSLSPRVAISTEFALNHPKAVTAVRDLLEEKLYIADTGNNRVILIELPENGPVVAYNRMKARMSEGDFAGAMAYFEKGSKAIYREAYEPVSKQELKSAVGQMGTGELISIEDDDAKCRLETLVDGKKTISTLNFRKEGGKWKIKWL